MNRVIFIGLLFSTKLLIPADLSGSDDKSLPETVDLRPEFAKWELSRAQGGRKTCSVFMTVGGVRFRNVQIS